MKEKDPWLLLEIAKRLKPRIPSLKLLMVGDGPGLEALKSYSRSLGLSDCVKFLGYLPHDTLPKIYSRCILTFIPLSMWDLDPFWDGALKESLACETAVAGFNQTIRGFDGAKRRFGLLLPAHVGKAAEILSNFLDEREYLKGEGVEGRRFIATHCSWESVIRRLVDVYNQILEF